MPEHPLGGGWGSRMFGPMLRWRSLLSIGRRPRAQWSLRGTRVLSIIGAAMLFDAEARRDAPTPEAAALQRAGAPTTGSRRLASLILFVGPACRPGPRECESLAQEGMRCLWAASSVQALEAAGAAQFDAAVVDHALLVERGGATLARLRAALNCPIAMLAPRPLGEDGDEIDEILALEFGADAYVQRPVAPRRLRAHLSALIRCGLPRSQVPSPESETETAPTWQVDRVGNRLLGAGGSIALTEVQCAFLQCLLEAQGRIVPRSHLAAALVRGHALHARSVDVYVYRLRKRLHEAGVSDLSIESVRGRGYVLHAPG